MQISLPTRVLVLLALILPLTGCQSIVPDTAGTDPAETKGMSDQEKLDRYLAGAVNSKEILETTARKFKQGYSQDLVVSATSRARYQSATVSLDAFKAGVRADLVSGQATTSPSTQQALDGFNSEVRGYQSYYNEVSGTQSKGFLLIGLKLVGTILEEYDNYDQARKAALIEQVDQRLDHKAWETL